MPGILENFLFVTVMSRTSFTVRKQREEVEADPQGKVGKMCPNVRAFGRSLAGRAA